MQIEVGNLQSRIVTDNPELLKTLQKLYTFKVPGAEFTSAYKSRRWNGDKKFISDSGLFRTGLLNSILKDLKRVECEPEISEEKTHLELNPYDIPGITLYDFQKQLVKDALEIQRGVIQSPTGSGKTVILAALIKALWGRPMVILFRAKQLLIQTYKFLTEDCKIKNVGFAFGEGYQEDDIMLCTVQSVDKILDSHLETAEVLFIDEVHEFPNGKVTKAAIESFPKATHRYGLTATPPKDAIPKFTLEGALGPTIVAKSTAELIEEGKLTKPVVQFIKIPRKDHRDTDLTYPQVYDQYIVNNKNRNQKIAKIVDKTFTGKNQAKILILVKNIQHIHNLLHLMPFADSIQGEDDLSVRYSKINKFLESGKSCLIATKVAQTGVNIKEITHIINGAGYKSEIPTVQGLGRALRKHESKLLVYYYDFVDPYKYLSEHSKNRKKILLNEGHEVTTL